MPYCSKCGAELSADAKFCPACGTQVGPPVSHAPEPVQRERRRRPISTLAIVLIVLIAGAAIVAAMVIALSFLPLRPVGPISDLVSVPSSPGADTLNLTLATDVARIKISYEDLSGEPESPAVLINASADGRIGFIGSAELLDRYMPVTQTDVDGNIVAVTITQNVGPISWPSISSLNVTYLVRIDPSMKTNLDVATATGGVSLDTKAGVVLESLRLEATTGGIDADLAKATINTNDISIKTTTGGIRLSWDNVVAANDIEIDAQTTTGGVEVDVTHNGALLADVVLNAKAVTGGVTLRLEIKGNVGARIESSVVTGGVDVHKQAGFSGPETTLQSNNYPASHNFEVTLETTTGGIDIDAKYTP